MKSTHNKYRNIIILLAITALLFASCDEISDRGKGVKNKAESAACSAKKKAERKVSEVLPIFDPTEADTYNNKLRFEETLQFAVTNDIKELYGYGEFLGFEAFIAFAFFCDDSTAAKIISKHNLSKEAKSNINLDNIYPDYEWWDLPPGSLIDRYLESNQSYYKFFWFDSDKSKAYYLYFEV